MTQELAAYGYLLAAICFIALAVTIGVQDLLRARRRTPSVG